MDWWIERSLPRLVLVSWDIMHCRIIHIMEPHHGLEPKASSRGIPPSGSLCGNHIESKEFEKVAIHLGGSGTMKHRGGMEVTASV
mmetsp:Transcript_9469/g.28250  ORF Transcript_9469/g.28250 Transcript_9469/m.28250 type:complete len:85 (-) Transcript_9469:265-519(-)